MNTLQIIGLCLTVPFLVFIVVVFCSFIVEDIKKNHTLVAVCVIFIMAIVGTFLLAIGA